MNSCTKSLNNQFHRIHQNIVKEILPQTTRLYDLSLILIFIATFFHSLCQVSAKTMTTLPMNSSSTPNASIPVTLKPSQKLHYTMKVDVARAAVLDSTVTFYAILTPITNRSTEHWPYRYIYQWMNMANTKDDRQDNMGLNGMISLAFSSSTVSAGQYPMTVAAFQNEDPRVVVAFDTIKFTLTEQLNGNLDIQQYLDYQRFPDKVFSTNVKTKFCVYLMDTFRSSNVPVFTYKWFENKTSVKKSNDSTYTATFAYPSNLTVSSEVFVKFHSEFNQFHRLSERTHLERSTFSTDHPTELSRFQRDTKREAKFGFDRNQKTENKNEWYFKKLEKEGNFVVSLLLKDQLTDCLLYHGEGDPKEISVTTDTPFVLNVTCSGSAPTSVCWNTSAISDISINPCQPGTFLPVTEHQIKVTLNKTGWVNLHLFVYNDVSRVHINKTLYVYDPDSSETPSLYLPIIFGVLSFIIVAIGAIYVMRLRKKPLVEVADFDFHPSLTTSMEAGNSIRFSRMISTLKYKLFARNKNTNTPINEEGNDFSNSTTPLTVSTESTKENALLDYGSL